MTIAVGVGPASNRVEGGSTTCAVTLTGAGAASIATDTEEAMVYVPSLDAYLFRQQGSGGTVYQINASTWEVTSFSTTGGGSIPAAARGIWHRFRYVPNLGGCVYVPQHAQNIWFLRVH